MCLYYYYYCYYSWLSLSTKSIMQHLRSVDYWELSIRSKYSNHTTLRYTSLSHVCGMLNFTLLIIWMCLIFSTVPFCRFYFNIFCSGTSRLGTLYIRVNLFRNAVYVQFQFLSFPTVFCECYLMFISCKLVFFKSIQCRISWHGSSGS